MMEAHQLALFFVPQAQKDTLETGPHRQDNNLLEDRVFFVTLLQLIIGNSGAQMMDVVKTDIARKPLQHFG